MNHEKPSNGDVKKKWLKNIWRVLIFLVIAIIILLLTSHPVAPWSVILGIVVIWLVCAIILLIVGSGEGEVFDLWSIIHFLSGFVLGLLCVPLFWATLLMILWELVEIFGDIQENRKNAIMDVILGMIAWVLAKAIFGLAMALF